MKLKIAALGDLHVRENSKGIYKNIFEEISKVADVFALCGDLTDHGTIEEAKVLAEEMLSLSIPVIGVLGNHDFDNGQEKEIEEILGKAKMIIFGDEPWEYKGVSFVGVKGFGGGFDKHVLGPFGESINKQFVYETINEVLKLEKALSLAKSEKKVVILHYSPISQTVQGEPLEIYPFLGSTRLEEPIDRFDVSLVFHGHSNLGKLQGKTYKGIPVYNVALPLLGNLHPKKNYQLVEI